MVAKRAPGVRRRALDTRLFRLLGVLPLSASYIIESLLETFYGPAKVAPHEILSIILSFLLRNSRAFLALPNILGTAS